MGGKLAALILFLSFAGAGMMLLSAVLADAAGLSSGYVDMAAVAPLMITLPLAKRLSLCVVADEETARIVALIIGTLSVLLFYLSTPRAGCNL